MSNLIDLNRLVEGKYLAAIMMKGIEQYSVQARSRTPYFDNPRVLKEWSAIITSDSELNTKVDNLLAQLEKYGVKDEPKIKPFLTEILNQETELIGEIKNRINEEPVRAMETTKSFEEFQNMPTNPADEIHGDAKMFVLAGEISWAIWKRLIDRKIEAMRAESGGPKNR